MDKKTFIIGIDLGTSVSRVGVYSDGRITVIDKDVPSYVAFTDSERLIGAAAKRQAAVNPTNTIYDVKRLIGRRFDDATVQSGLKYWPFKIVNDDGKPKIRVEYKGQMRFFTPEEISSMILVKMKETAEAFLGATVSEAVISVPAFFNDSQRQATKDAATIAGLNVIRLINEPTAAAIAYSLQNTVSERCDSLVFKLGGGTFDVSIAHISQSFITVKSIAGDTNLGGGDFDNRLVDHFVQKFKIKHNKDLSSNPDALQRLRTACESAKCTLSNSSQASIELDSLHDGIDFSTSITRAHFEQLCADLFRATLAHVERALRDAKKDKSVIHKIILLGGSTGIPKIQQLVKDFFDGKELDMFTNPNEAVAFGSTLWAAKPFNKLPSYNQLNIFDVIPLSLGIETNGGLMTSLFKRNSLLPASKTQIFTTDADNQSGILIRVYEGDRVLAKDNNLLGKFELIDIPIAPRGVPQIEVSFYIDHSGILNVSAKDKSTGSMVTVLSDTGDLSDVEIERMINEAALYREQNAKKRERLSAKNSLESYCHNLKSTMANDKNKDKILAVERKTVLATCSSATKWLHANQLAEKNEFDRKFKEVEVVCKPIIARLWATGGSVSDGARGRVESAGNHRQTEGCFWCRPENKTQGESDLVPNFKEEN